jgi:hypothetical protein
MRSDSIVYLLVGCGPLALMGLYFAIDLFLNRHPLNAQEVRKLAEKRRRSRALSEFGFLRCQMLAHPEDKKAMNALGEFVVCDFDYEKTPSRVAGLLKYKKHEWIVFAFIREKRVTRLWWNKGPDGTMVWPFLHGQALEKAIESLKPDALAILHNHPNPNPTRYCLKRPSETDLNSAASLHRRLATHRITLLEFICERGVPHLYYAAFPDHLVPVEPILTEIHNLRGIKLFKNYSLRKALNSQTDADRILGANDAQLAQEVGRKK